MKKFTIEGWHDSLILLKLTTATTEYCTPSKERGKKLKQIENKTITNKETIIDRLKLTDFSTTTKCAESSEKISSKNSKKALSKNWGKVTLFKMLYSAKLLFMNEREKRHFSRK